MKRRENIPTVHPDTTRCDRSRPLEVGARVVVMNASSPIPSRRRAPPAGEAKGESWQECCDDTSAQKFPAISANPANLSPDPLGPPRRLRSLTRQVCDLVEGPWIVIILRIAASPRTANDHRNGMLNVARDHLQSRPLCCRRGALLVFLSVSWAGTSSTGARPSFLCPQQRNSPRPRQRPAADGIRRSR